MCMKHECHPHDERPLLPVTMLQSSKSLLVIQEATKNDRTAISRKLLEYIVDLQAADETKEPNRSPATSTSGANCLTAAAAAGKNDKEGHPALSWCTAREQSVWILNQLHDIFFTKQHWRIRKVTFILHTLIWRGSRAFIEEFHDRLCRREYRFFDFELILSWLHVPQANPSGTAVPSVLHPGTNGVGSPCEDQAADRVHEATETIMGQFYDPASLTEREAAFFECWKKNAAKNDFKTTDECIQCAWVEDQMVNHMGYLESLVNYRYEYPQVDVMGITVHDANIRGGTEEEGKLSLTVLEGLMASTLELLKATAFKNVDVPVCAMNGMTLLFRYHNAHVLYTIATQIISGIVAVLVREFIISLREIDRNGPEASVEIAIKSLSSIVGDASELQRRPHISRASYDSLSPSQKLSCLAREWYIMIYQFNRTGTFYASQCAKIQQMVDLPVRPPEWVHLLPEDSFSIMKTYGAVQTSAHGCPWCCSEEETPSCRAEGEHHVPPCVVRLVGAWKQQVANARALFTKKAPCVLQTLESELTEVEREYATPTPSPSSTGLSARRESTSFHEDMLTSTFVVRRSSPSSSGSSSSLRRAEMTTEVMYLGELMDKTTEALLEEDDVVVVCPDDFSATDRLKLADRFVVLKERPLGEGSYGKVYRAWDELLGSYLAAKEVPLDSSKGTLTGAVREALHEYTILTQLHHPHIVAVRAFMVAGSVGTIFMEWMPSGSLQEVLRSNPRGCLREPVVARFMRDALRGLEYLHSRDIMHRDVKPANMLLGTDGSVKLTDFGNSFVMAEGRHTIENNTITGTAPYIAPECAQGTYSPAGDVWSLGCTAVELLSGLVPWSDPVTGSRPETIPLIFRIGMLDDKTRTDRPHILMWDNMVKKAGKEGLCPELRSFLDAILVVNRHARPTATQLLQHPFILKYDTIY